MRLLDILRQRFPKSFAVKCLEDGDSSKFVAQRIRQNAPNFELKYKLSLNEYTEMYDLGIDLPSEVGAAIAHNRGREHFGHAFSTPYHMTLSVLKYLEPTVYEDNDLVQLLIAAKAAAAAASEPQLGGNPQDHFDMDRD